MNSSVAIRVQDLSKRYHIGGKQQRYRTLRESLTDSVLSPFRRISALARGTGISASNGDAAIWALKDVSFEVQRGEVIGVIGRNGAGKSTILKVLSRITEPTAGYAEIHGRVGSLLEVGTGFHMELTGRENIYLNGAILGMKRTDIERKFDEIVAFSGIDTFLDTPVKHYSSGMYLRLAFGVAAHLEPEILLVDEVLAVGDAEFQRKCLGKMDEVAKEGRTVLFVSHNMAAISRLCRRAFLFKDGTLAMAGDTQSVIDAYLGGQDDGEFGAITEDTSAVPPAGRQPARITRVEVADQKGNPKAILGIGDSVTLKLDVVMFEPVVSLIVGAQLKSQLGLPILNLRSDSQGVAFGPYASGQSVQFSLTIPSLPLYSGVYVIDPWVAVLGGERLHYRQSVRIVLESKGHFKSEQKIQNGKGILVMDCEWDAAQMANTPGR